MKTKKSCLKSSAIVCCALAISPIPLSAAINVLWWDSTPEYGGQAPDSLRKEMSDYLTSFSGGSVFNSTYVSSESQGAFSTHMSSNSYDVIVFDATSYSAKFNAADLAAAQSFFSANHNLLLDGDLYVRSIDYNYTSNFPGINSSTGSLTVNEVYQLGNRGGGIMIGTDHAGYQVDANQILNALVPLASFSGITYPSTDGVFYGNDLLGGISPVAASDLFTHFDSIPTQAIAPTGAFTDFSGNSISLYSQLDVADDPGGGPKFSYISTSWAPGSGSTGVTDPNPGGNGGNPRVPEGGQTLFMLLLSLGALIGITPKVKTGKA